MALNCTWQWQPGGWSPSDRGPAESSSREGVAPGGRTGHTARGMAPGSGQQTRGGCPYLCQPRPRLRPSQCRQWLKREPQDESRHELGAQPCWMPTGQGLTLVAPVDTGDLDLLRGDVLLHKLLALEPVPQSRLARVPVPPDHYFHCNQRGQVVKTQHRNSSARRTHSQESREARAVRRLQAGVLPRAQCSQAGAHGLQGALHSWRTGCSSDWGHGG